MTHPSAAVGGGVGYRIGTFRHNARVACALLPAVFMLAGAGGSLVAGTLLAGVMIAYVLDVLKMPEGALATTWCALAGAYLASLISGDVFFTPARSDAVATMLVVNAGATLFLCGLWITLQFRWVQISHPGVALASEKLLFALAPSVCGPMLTWVASASFGAASAPFYASAAFAALYRAFSLPTPSSFRVLRGASCTAAAATSATPASASASDARATNATTCILRPRDAMIHFLLFLLVPPAAYARTHAPTMFPGGFTSGGRDAIVGGVDAGAIAEHWSAVCALLSFPVVFACACAPAGGTWWADGGGGGGDRTGVARSNSKARTRIAAAALAVFVGSAESRVVFHGFGEYVRVPAPWSYVLVTVALYGGLGACVAAASGALGERGGVPTRAAAAACAIAGVAGVVAVGAPPWTCPFAAASGWHGASFATSRDARSGFVFVAGAGVCAHWFLRRNFWDLDVAVDGAPMSELCFFLLFSLLVALAAPGMAACGARASSIGTLLCVHALVFARCEEALYAEVLEDGEPMYPPYLVVATSALGVALSEKLKARGTVTDTTGWLMKCVYAGKLAIAMIPGDRALVPCVLVALAASSPHVVDPGVGGGGGAKPRNRRMSPARGLAHAAFLVLALIHARFAAFDVVFAITGHRPSDAVLFGGLLACAGIGNAPLARAHFSRSRVAARAVTLTTTAGVLLCALKPPMPWKGEIGFWYDEAHVPDAEPDDANVYGTRIGARAGWPCWLLIFTILVASFVASSPPSRGLASGAGGAEARFVLSAAAGAAGGVYLAVEHFPGSDVPLRTSIATACALAGVFVAFVHAPSGGAPRWLPLVFGAYLACLAAAYASQHPGMTGGGFGGEGGGSFGGGGGHESAHERARMEDARAGVASVLAGLSLQIAFALKLKVSGISRGASVRDPNRRVDRARPGPGPGGVMRGASRGTAVTGKSDGASAAAAGFSSPYRARRSASAAASLAHRALSSSNLAWMPVLGNVATVVAYLASASLTRRIGSRTDAETATIALAPILLLLHEDGFFFETLRGGRKRYVPPLVATAVSLCASAMVRAARGPLRGSIIPLPMMTTRRAPYALRNVALTACATPCVGTLARYLWTFQRVSGGALAMLAPLNALTFVAADVRAARALACVSMACAVAQWAMQRRVRFAGMRAL